MSTAREDRSPPFDAKLDASVRKVLRACGVPEADENDLCQRVRLACHVSTSLPATEPERTQYIHGVARNLARKHRGAAARQGETVPLEDAEGALAAPPVPLESIDLARKLHAEAVARDPQGADWLVRAKVYGVSEVRIADRDGVPVHRVRKRIQRLVASMRQHPLVVASLAGMLLVVTFLGWWVTPDERVGAGRPNDLPPVVSSGQPYQPTVNEQQAAAVRRTAVHACEARQWKACLDGLDAARKIDPAGDATQEVQAARRAAEAGSGGAPGHP